MVQCPYSRIVETELPNHRYMAVFTVLGMCLLVCNICALTAPMVIACYFGHYLVTVFVFTCLRKRNLYTKQVTCEKCQVLLHLSLLCHFEFTSFHLMFYSVLFPCLPLNASSLELFDSFIILLEQRP